MQTQNHSKIKHTIPKKKLKNGQIGLLLVPLLLSACVSSEINLIKPEYDEQFFNCLIESVEKQKYMPCTERALTDFIVIIED